MKSRSWTLPIECSQYFSPRCDGRKDKLQEQLTRLVQFHENMISALTWLTSAESKIAELDSAVDAAEEHPDLTSLKEELKVRIDR